jgi:hypothetical protein
VPSGKTPRRYAARALNVILKKRKEVAYIREIN